MATQVGGLGGKAFGSVALVGGAQMIRLVLTTLSTIVVSRLLAPDDYGVVAMAAPITGFILLFQDFGLGQAAIQARELPPEKMNGLFWVNMFATGLIAVALLAAAPGVAWFYGDPRPGYITAAAVVPVLIGGFGLQHSALLSRQMRFGVSSMIDVVTNLAMFLGTLGFALLLRNFWALFLGGVVGKIVQVTMMWRSEPWRPTWRMSVRGTGELARFGGNLTGFNLINFVCRNLDNVIIARFSGASQLGLYDRSYRLMMLPLDNINGPLNRVMMPVLSRLRDDPARYRNAFLMTVRGLLLLALPGIAVAAATSDQIITFLLGQQWASAGPIFFWLSLLSLLQPLANVTGLLFITSGRTREMRNWGLFSGVLTIIGFAVGIRWGAEGVAASLFITSAIRFPLLFSYCTIETPVSSADIWQLTIRPALFVGLSYLATILLKPYLPIGPLLCAAIVCAYAISLGITAASRDGRALLSAIHVQVGARLKLPLRRPARS